MTVQRHAQRGLSMIGFLFVATVLVVVAIVGFRMVPSYIEYYTVQSAVEKSLKDAPDPSPQVVRKSFEKYIAADYIDSVSHNDLVIAKEGNVITATVTWQKQLHMIGNVSLLLDFQAQAQR